MQKQKTYLIGNVGSVLSLVLVAVVVVAIASFVGYKLFNPKIRTVNTSPHKENTDNQVAANGTGGDVLSKSTKSRWKITPTPTRAPTPTPTHAPTPTASILPSITPTPTPSGSTGQKWGAYTGWQVSDIANFQSKIGIKMDYVALFVHWGNENEFPIDAATFAKSNGSTVVIYWEAMDYNFDGPNDTRFNYDAILAGKWDSYIQSFAQSVKNYGKEVILIPFEEMNSDWYPWSGTINGNTPAKHIAAFRYLKNKFEGISNVKFAWDVNNDSVPDTSENAINKYYPGNDYVDIVGVDGFNFGSPWQTWSSAYSSPLTKLQSYSKPIMILSMACAQGSAKAAWIKDALTQISNRPQIVGWIWFNENKEKDWRVWSDSQSLAAFQTTVRSLFQ